MADVLLLAAQGLAVTEDGIGVRVEEDDGCSGCIGGGENDEDDDVVVVVGRSGCEN